MRSNWGLTVGDILKRPQFQQAECVAGSRGLTKSIRWVHILERPDFVTFLNGGELILSTGVGLGGDPTHSVSYLQDLIARKAVGLCIELGDHFPCIPPEMKELADHLEFPLIVFHVPVRFVDITMELHESIVSYHTYSLRKLEAFSRSLQQITLEGQGIPKILNLLQAKVQTQVFFMSLDGPSFFSPAMPQSVQNELTERFTLLQDKDGISLEQQAIVTIAEKKQIFYQPISAMGHVLAYLGVVLYEREADELLQLTTDYAATAMTQILLRRMFVEERAHDEQSRIIDDLLMGQLENERQILGMLGIEHTAKPPRYTVLIMQLHQDKTLYEDELGVPFYDLLNVYRSILRRNGFRSLIRSKGNRLYLLLMELNPALEIRQAMEKVVRELKNSTSRSLGADVGVSFGVSRPSNRYLEVKRHFLEAEEVLTNQDCFSSPYYDDLGLHRVLLAIPDQYVLEAFVEDYLGPLLEQDRSYHSQLLLTLRALLDHHGSKQEAAEHLFIHRQTLYHRLGKISELIGSTYLEPNHRRCLELAIQVYDWLQRKT
ncbi:PucR family transcriptional regulator [Brevibacillus ginsengisoli]|uniref:PucR family transcriptional regulator n=1 Tax=Brevibacillus ginsengisoli TaxID=363854 RepID=UPI003CF11707